MSEEDLLNLQHQVQHHEGELTQLVDRITQLQKDLEIAIRFSIPNVVAQASQYGRGRGSQSSWVNPPAPADDVAFREACAKFAEKYASLAGR